MSCGITASRFLANAVISGKIDRFIIADHPEFTMYIFIFLPYKLQNTHNHTPQQKQGMSKHTLFFRKLNLKNFDFVQLNQHAIGLVEFHAQTVGSDRIL